MTDVCSIHWPEIETVRETVAVDYRGASLDVFSGDACLYPRNGAKFDDSVANNDDGGAARAERAEREQKRQRMTSDLAEQDSRRKANLIAENSVHEQRLQLTQRFICAIPEAWTRLEEMREALFVQQSLTVELACAVAAAYRAQPDKIYPPKQMVFRALKLVSPEQVRVVIVGQDPYMFAGQADGLAFSIGNGRKPPPSLCNIFREMGLTKPDERSGDLTSLAERGVLLLNTALTVEHGKPGSHRAPNVDWERLTDAIIRSIANGKRRVCFMLWGNAAQRKLGLIGGDAAARHLVLTASHPSPKSAERSFIGCRHFQRCDEWLDDKGGRIFEPWCRDKQHIVNGREMDDALQHFEDVWSSSVPFKADE